ncbi:MAG TPA: hypothetical protein VND68_10535 [Chloroflexia bacterium]|nr:hypothetical protein [Chloroflexia bacterium]
MTTTLEIPSLPRGRVATRGVPGRRAVTPLLRWLVLLVGLFGLLAGAYSSATHWRSDGANAVSAPLVPGTRLGQTFVSRYPGLSGLEVRVNGQYLRGREAGATLVMHLRAAPGAGPDLATATVHVTGEVQESQYQRFTFPSLPNSLDKTYYVELESPDATPDNAPALLWWIQFDPNLPTDTYAGGTAYLDGQPQQSDLAFGLTYDPSPLDAFRGLARHAGTNLPSLPILLFLALAIAVTLLATYLAARPKFEIRTSKSEILLLSLPIALAVALANGVFFSLVLPPWQGPDEHGHFAYAALLYRHGMDDDAVQALQWQEGGNDHAEALALKAAVIASMSEHDWTRLVSGHPTPGAPAFPPGGQDLYLEFMWQIRQPAPYYWLCAASLHVANALGAGVDPFAGPAAALRVMRLVSVLLNVALVGLAWLAGVLLGGRRLPWLRLALPLAVALLPMHTFIASVVSNDVISDLAVTALFVALVALLKWPFGRRGVGLAALSVLLLGAGAFTKLTALVAGGPLLGLVLLVWVGLLLTRYLPQWRIARRFSRAARGGDRPALSPYVVPGIVATGFLLLCLVGALLLFRPSPAVAAWQAGGGPSVRPARIQMAAHSGSYAMQVQPGLTIYQWVELPWPHPAYTATLTFWAQLGEMPAPKPGEIVVPVESRAELAEDQRGTLSRIGADTLGRIEYRVPFTPTRGEWRQFTISNTGTHADRKVWVRYTGGTTGFYVDDVSLTATPILAAGTPERERAGMPQEVRLPLFNPSMETGSLAVSPLGARVLRGETLDIVDVLVNPQAFDKLTIWQRYAYRQFRSFWGNFGWLSIPLPEFGYAIMNALILVVLVALLSNSVRRLGTWTPMEWLGMVTLLALVAAILVTFARMLGPLSTSGVHTDPQGRYLFGYTVPVMWLMCEGLYIAWSWLAGVARRNNVLKGVVRPPAGLSASAPATTLGAATLMPWGAWSWCVAVAFFAGYSLLVLVVPYYYR